MPRILWATTFSADLYEISGRQMIESFVASGTPHRLVAYVEGVAPDPLPKVEFRDLAGNAFLSRFLEKNHDIIPQDLGGSVPVGHECKCAGGPFDVHSKRHKLPCVGYWFCRNSFRWLRKVLSAKLAADSHPDFDIMIWVDSDVVFKKKIMPEIVSGWFPKRAGCTYLKSRRTAIETGIVCYHLRNGGRTIIDNLVKRYGSGTFRRDYRWDDCVQLEKAIKATPKIVTVDLAKNVGPNNTVVQFSPLGTYLAHNKGAHRRAGALK